MSSAFSKVCEFDAAGPVSVNSIIQSLFPGLAENGFYRSARRHLVTTENYNDSH